MSVKANTGREKAAAGDVSVASKPGQAAGSPKTTAKAQKRRIKRSFAITVASCTNVPARSLTPCSSAASAMSAVAIQFPIAEFEYAGVAYATKVIAANAIAPVKPASNDTQPPRKPASGWTVRER